jgi:hypothetical protein
MAEYLSKSDFKAVRECPTKLFYRKQNYPCANDGNEYLEFLADGGYMSEAIAKLLYPDGIEVGFNRCVEQAFANTLQWLALRDEITLFEATVLHERMCARIDILRKQGACFQLIEVKAKSMNSAESPRPFRGKRGGILRPWEPYLADVTYQTWLLRACFPEAEVTPFLCLVDKAQTVDLDAVFAQFRLMPAPDDGRRYRRPEVTFLGDADRLRAKHILNLVDVTDEVAQLMPGVQAQAAPLVDSLRNGLRKLPAEIGVHCRGCEYRGASTADDRRDGFRECWGGLADADPHILDYYKVSQIKQKREPLANFLVRQGRAGLADIEEANLCNADGEVGSDHKRRRLQRRCTLAGQEYRSPELSALVTAWRYPLHFIDFETSRIAVPYHAGMHPYEQVAFQWSCHRVNAPGAKPEHFEWINVQDAYPNFEFARTLRDCVGDVGTVLTWWHHERLVLNEINAQLARYKQPEPALCAWLTRVTGKDALGTLSLVDLHEVAREHYYHPRMKGSWSLKDVLPAVWESNPRLHAHPTFERYCRRDPAGRLMDPYATLPPLPFSDVGKETDEVVKDGAGAMRAYQEMMYGLTKNDAALRQNWRRLLLQYCELDTAAMIMAWLHWAEPIAGL